MSVPWGNTMTGVGVHSGLRRTAAIQCEMRETKRWNVRKEVHVRQRPDATIGRRALHNATRRDYRERLPPEFGQTAMSRSSTDDDGLLPCTCASLAGLVYMVETEHVFGCEFVVVDRVV